MSHPIISQCPLFATLSPEECRIVSEMMTACCYEVNEPVIQEGQETCQLYLITTGECCVTKMVTNGEPQELDTLGPGSVFGEMSFFCRGPHSASVIAKERSTIFSLSQERFQELQSERPSAALKITLHATATLSQRLRRMDNWTCELVERKATPEKNNEWYLFRSKLYTEWNF